MSTIVLASSFWSNPIVIIVGLVLLFGLVAAGVFLFRKYSHFFTHDDEGPKSDAEIAEEELNRILVDVEDEETKRQMEEYVRNASKKAAKEAPPTPEEVAREEMARILEPVTDIETAKAMEEYVEEHPEEAEAVSEADEEKAEK